MINTLTQAQVKHTDPGAAGVAAATGDDRSKGHQGEDQEPLDGAPGISGTAQTHSGVPPSVIEMTFLIYKLK